MISIQTHDLENKKCELCNSKAILLVDCLMDMFFSYRHITLSLCKNHASKFKNLDEQNQKRVLRGYRLL